MRASRFRGKARDRLGLRIPVEEKLLGFFRIRAIPAGAGNCSCISGMSAQTKNALRFQVVGPSRHPPENAPAFPACRPKRKCPSFSGCRAIQAPAGNCSCISGVRFNGNVLRFQVVVRSRHPPENAPAFPACRPNENALRFQVVVRSRHPPKNAPAFPAYRPSMAIKKAAILGRLLWHMARGGSAAPPFG